MFGITKRRTRRKGSLFGSIIIYTLRKGPWPYSYEVVVDRTQGRTKWRERMFFSVDRYDATRNIVEITDEDYPNDRKLTLVINQQVDMESFITSFILSGRW